MSKKQRDPAPVKLMRVKNRHEKHYIMHPSHEHDGSVELLKAKYTLMKKRNKFHSGNQDSDLYSN